MFGRTFLIVGTLAFLCAHTSKALTPQQADSVCALLADGENIANPVDCSQFYSCTKGKATLNSCLGNNLFSKESQACVPASQASCGSQDADPCANVPDGYFVSVFNSCSDFYYCEGGVGAKSSCSNGLNFDQQNQACKYQSEYPCAETTPGDEKINVCEAVRYGIYFGAASSCKTWQKCQLNGPLEIGTCPDPFVFNVDTQACDYTDNVKCRQLQGTPGVGGPSLEGTPCETNGEVKADTTCTGYYVCANGKFAFGKCINGLYFNPKTNKCVSRLDAINDCDRCEGTKMQFVNLYQDNCIGYAHCRDGKKQSTGECSNGYFSEVDGSCVQNGDNPEYPVCYVPDESESTSTTPVSTTSTTTTKAPLEPESPGGKPGKPNKPEKPSENTSDKPDEASGEKPNESDEEPNESDKKPNESDEKPNESDKKPSESDEKPNESDGKQPDKKPQSGDSAGDTSKSEEKKKRPQKN